MKTILCKTLVLLLLGLSISCDSGGGSLSSSPAKLAEVNKYGQKLKSGQRLTNEEFDKLTAIQKEFPNDETAWKHLETALTKRKDWKTLAEFYEATGLDTPELESKAAASYFRFGKYSKAEELSKDFDMSKTNLRRIRVGALYNLGNYKEASKILDKHWKTVVEEKGVDEYVFRGMIHFYDKENDKALEVLESAIEIDPKNIPAYNGLSRVYTAVGKEDKAKEALEKLRSNYEELTKVERAKTRFVEKIYKIQEDYKNKRYSEVIVTAKQIESEVPANQKKVFYQYMFNSYKALGREAEAREVMNKARQLK